MNYISVDSVSKQFGDKILFNQLSFGLSKGQKVGLIAKNGAGKTTLLRILTGLEQPDSGEVAVQKDITVGYLDQAPFFADGSTIKDYIFQSGSPLIEAIKDYEESMANYSIDPSPGNQLAMENATSQMELLKAWDFEVTVRQVLSTFRIDDLDQMADNLSGGQQKRVALARVLIESPDLLILDEPTNHLDLDMIEWLENYLSRANLSLLLVTHDRYFLDRICQEIIELEDQKIYQHKGNYTYFLNNKAEREAQQDREVSKAKNLMRKELEWVRRMPKARGTKSKARLDAFDGLQQKAQSGKNDDSLQLQVKMSRMGRKILEIDDLNKSFGDYPILKDFSYTFKRKEKIGIVGRNGVGKSTFLNMIMGLEPADSGQMAKGETIVYGYYSQRGIELPADKRVIDVVKDIAEIIPQADGNNITASQLLQTFLFPPAQQYAYVSTLSGGEKRRLYLLTVLMKNPNFLILDEPTNDLDLITLSTLEAFLENFDGCLLVVTHDRYFMDRLVDQLFVFEGEGKVKAFNGAYSDYRDMKDAEEQLAKQAQKQPKKAPVQTTPKPSAQQQTKKLSYKEQKEYDGLERKIADLEEKKEAISEKLSSGSLTDYQEISNLSKEVEQLTATIEEMTFRWIELAERAN